MLYYWIKSRFFSGSYYKDLFLTIFFPIKIKHKIENKSEACYFHAFDFLWGSIKLGILISLLASLFLPVKLSEIVWYAIFIIDFLLLGLITSAVLFILREKNTQLSNIYQCLAYPAGAAIIIMTLTTSIGLISEQAKHDKLFNTQQLIDLGLEQLVDFLAQHAYIFQFMIYIAIVFLIWSFGLFLWMMKENLELKFWKLLPAFSIAISCVVSFTIFAYQVETELSKMFLNMF